MKRTLAVLVLLALIAGAAIAQEADLDRVAIEQKITDRIESFVEMGMEREAATFFALLEQSGMEPAQMLTMFMMGEMAGDEMAGMMLMDAMKGGGGTQPVVLERSNGGILIVDDGVLYLIGTDPPLRVTGRLDYAVGSQAERDAIWAVMAPMIAEHAGGEVPGGNPARSCQNNLKQLGQAFGMYVDDHQGSLPGENWVEAITPYLVDTAILRCPSRPDLTVGYAMNAKMAGARYDAIVEPGERILLFDTTMQADSPVGGPEAVPEGFVHEDGLNVLFADGRVEWLKTAEVREVMGFPLGE